jgi:homoserine acetyltransferase
MNNAVQSTREIRIGESKMEILAEEGVFVLGAFDIESGIALKNAIIAYKTHGKLNADKSNVADAAGRRSRVRREP